MSKKNLIALFSLGLIILIIGSCSDCNSDNENNNNKDIIETKALFDKTITSCRIQHADSIVHQSVDLVITNQVDYEYHVACATSLPQIDFTKSSLLIGKIFWPSCANMNSQILYSDCDGFKLVSSLNTSSPDGVLCGSETVLTYFLIVQKQSYANITYQVIETK